MVKSDYLFQHMDNTLIQLLWCCSPYPDFTPSASTAGMPAYAEISSYSAYCHCLCDVATVHLQPLLTPAAAGYVIECYQASLKCYVLSIDSKGTNSIIYSRIVGTSYRPYGITLEGTDRHK